MERVERVDSAHATWTKELDREAIEATIRAVVVAELAAVTISEYPPPFESYGLLEVSITFWTP